ncbi:MAG: 3-dehydroquinate synthase, partial [Pseudonocardiales bacterium]|nr:3-dehydroquinate synthase [Pseudonocardiales bacterium]
MTVPDGPTRIPVTGARSYEVVNGTGLLGELAGLLAGAQRVAVLHPPTLLATAEAVR